MRRWMTWKPGGSRGAEFWSRSSFRFPLEAAMYSKDGQSYYIVDGHTHFWDGSPANQINRYGEGFIKCFYDYHSNLSPDEYKWTLEEFERYPEERMIHDLFEAGHDDIAIL